MPDRCRSSGSLRITQLGRPRCRLTKSPCDATTDIGKPVADAEPAQVLGEPVPRLRQMRQAGRGIPEPPPFRDRRELLVVIARTRRRRHQCRPSARGRRSTVGRTTTTRRRERDRSSTWQPPFPDPCRRHGAGRGSGAMGPALRPRSAPQRSDRCHAIARSQRRFQEPAIDVEPAALQEVAVDAVPHARKRRHLGDLLSKRQQPRTVWSRPRLR